MNKEDKEGRGRRKDVCRRCEQRKGGEMEKEAEDGWRNGKETREG